MEKNTTSGTRLTRMVAVEVETAAVMLCSTRIDIKLLAAYIDSPTMDDNHMHLLMT